MKRVEADRYFLACDYASEKQLAPVAKSHGWEVFAGDRDDVLDRFCSLIENSFPECELIVRATGDNPFLFYEAAQLSVSVFATKYPDADYFTFTGLPHGSGVELFKAASLLKARSLTDSPFDHEHVGPSLYLHPENFKSLFVPAPAEFNFPLLRTTIDTFADYKRAERLVDFISGGKKIGPYAASLLIAALEDEFLQKTLLLVPSVKAGRGTGHLRRALEIAKSFRAFVYVPKDASLKETSALISEAISSGLKDFQIVDELMPGWDLILADLFRSTKEEIETLKKLGPLCSLDDGDTCSESADYLLDVIPSINSGRRVNTFNPGLIELPQRKRLFFPSKIEKALVCISGESRDGLSLLAADALVKNGVEVTVISSDKDAFVKKAAAFSGGLDKQINVLNPVRNLRECLCDYDLIFTHYGLTAFEAVAANCAVVLAATSSLHSRLSEKYGFICLPEKKTNASCLKKIVGGDLQKCTSPYFRNAFLENEGIGWNEVLKKLLAAEKFSCPVCKKGENPVFFRTKTHTFRRCRNCGISYISFSTDSRVQYEEKYFDSEYKNQYGRTYVQDFDSIKAQGLRRMKIIKSMTVESECTSSYPSILDIGCAYGPFLSAAKDSGFSPYGTDISKAALDYVDKNLGFKTRLSSFADFDVEKAFGFKVFDAVTMWYVIEHVRDLDILLRRVNGLLKKNGLFAFSTPSERGVSGLFNTTHFYEQSPRDHYTVWSPKSAPRILKKFGFKTVKIVPTGIHPERIPFIKNSKIQKGSLTFRLAALLCKWFRLGDTFEVYCRKVKEL